MPPRALTDDEISERLTDSAWRREGEGIARDWKLEDFAAALAFVNSVGEAAEAANHHPDVLLHDYNRVRVGVTTHSAGGLTAADFELAAAIDGLE